MISLPVPSEASSEVLDRKGTVAIIGKRFGV